MLIPRVNAPLSPVNDTGLYAATGQYDGSSSQAYQLNGTDPYRLDGVPAGRVASHATVDTSGEREGHSSERQTEHEAAQPTGTSTVRSDPSSATTQQQASNVQQSAVASNVSAPIATGVGVNVNMLGAQGSRSNYDSEKEFGKQDTSRMDNSNSAKGDDSAKVLVSTLVPLAEPTSSSATKPATDPTAQATADPASTAKALEAVPHTSLTAPRSVSTEAIKSLPLDSKRDAPPVLGGLEQEGAHETGKLFPAVIRHDTDVSVSRLHIPGGFPPKV